MLGDVGSDRIPQPDAGGPNDRQSGDGSTGVARWEVLARGRHGEGHERKAHPLQGAPSEQLSQRVRECRKGAAEHDQAETRDGDLLAIPPVAEAAHQRRGYGSYQHGGRERPLRASKAGVEIGGEGRDQRCAETADHRYDQPNEQQHGYKSSLSNGLHADRIQSNWTVWPSARD
jgi:hypothetical protein